MIILKEKSKEEKIAEAKAAGFPVKDGKQIVSISLMNSPFHGEPLKVMYDEDGKRYVE
jgi:hypothetical protein